MRITLSLSLLQTCCNMQTILGNPLKLCKVINYEHYTIQLFKRINTVELRLDAATKYVGIYILIFYYRILEIYHVKKLY